MWSWLDLWRLIYLWLLRFLVICDPGFWGHRVTCNYLVFVFFCLCTCCTEFVFIISDRLVYFVPPPDAASVWAVVRICSKGGPVTLLRLIRGERGVATQPGVDWSFEKKVSLSWWTVCRSCSQGCGVLSMGRSRSDPVMNSFGWWRWTEPVTDRFLLDHGFGDYYCWGPSWGYLIGDHFF